MLTVAAAIEKLVATVQPFGLTDITLEDSLGLVLGEDVYSPEDIPPFDKSLMDGYAVRSRDVSSGFASLRVTEIITAGRVPMKNVGAGEAAQIMTGAPMPGGADVVVKIEETSRDGDQVLIKTVPLRVGTNTILRGTSASAGDRVLRIGDVLSAPRIGALAELGYAVVPARRRPNVAVLATGDELVPIEEKPGPAQIRNSNASMLAAQIEIAGGIPVRLGIARDDRDELRLKIQQGLQCDILVLSGGVSAGTLDLVPITLAEMGVTEIFHKVDMKPGKPIWFGKGGRNGLTDHGDCSQCYVFGLPGNPVSSLVCCELFVRTAIRRLMGLVPVMVPPKLAKLEHDYSTRPDRPTYHPARLTQRAGSLAVTLVPWHGSSDLCGTVAANGMAYLSGEARQYRAGDELETFGW